MKKTKKNRKRQPPVCDMRSYLGSSGVRADQRAPSEREQKRDRGRDAAGLKHSEKERDRVMADDVARRAEAPSGRLQGNTAPSELRKPCSEAHPEKRPISPPLLNTGDSMSPEEAQASLDASGPWRRKGCPDPRPGKTRP